MKKAKLVKEDLKDFRGVANLYELTPAHKEKDFYDEIKSYKYVIVSAANVIFGGPKTYIFPANKKGKVVDWGKLDRSHQGDLSHEKALRNMGYKIEK